MLFSLALIFLAGFSLAEIFNRLKLPKIIGYLLTGILTGPFVLNFLDPKILGISAELRQIALIIILIKAGLSLNLSDLKKVGRPAVLMSFLPAVFEIIGYAVFAPILLNLNLSESLLMGAVLSAVSPAVVVPRMVRLIEQKQGTEKAIPQLILAGASCDDVFVIVLFSSFLTMNVGGSFNPAALLDIPVSIILGVLLGVLAGLLLSLIFSHFQIQITVKTIILLALAFLMMSVEQFTKGFAAVSGLLAVISMSCILKLKSNGNEIPELSAKFGGLWTGAEVLLFVLVGAAVDIRYTLSAGFSAVIMIFTALLFRTIGVLLCLIKTKLNAKERLFCVIAYLPKATVQAALGAVPLASGLACGNIILSAAVLAIIITAPLGAVGIDLGYKKLLKKQ